MEALCTQLRQLFVEHKPEPVRKSTKRIERMAVSVVNVPRHICNFFFKYLKKYLKISCRHQKDHLRVGHQFQWPSPHHGDATAKELPAHCRAHTVTPAAAIGEHFDAHMFFNLSYYLEAHTSSVWLQWHQNCFLVVFKRGYSYFNIMFLPSTFILMNLIDKYYLNQLFI